MVEVSVLGSIILYLIVMIISICLAKMSDRIVVGTRPAKNLFVFLSIILLTIVMMNRYGIGTDYYTYLNMYNNAEKKTILNWMKNYDFFSDMMPGIFVSARFGQFFSSYKLFFGILAALSVSPVIVALVNEWRQEYLTLAMFIYLMINYIPTGNIMKQSIAMAFALYGLKFVYEKKLVKYIICIMIAMLFHFTVVVTIPIYFLYDSEGTLKFSKKTLMIIGVIILLSSIDTIIPMIGGRWNTYLENQGSSNLSFFLNLFWLVIFLLCNKKLCEYDSKNSLLIFLQVIGLMFGFIGFWSVYIKRIALYYTFSQFLLIGQLPEIFDAKQKLCCKLLIVMYGLSYFVYVFGILSQSGMIPFVFKR